MTMISIEVDSTDLITDIPPQDIIRYYGVDICDWLHRNEIIEYLGGLSDLAEGLDTEQIDSLFMDRHPNPSEVLDYIDDEAIMDYLVNKGYNVEM